MKTAIVHIGAHKTGSTSIQMSLAQSKDGLNGQGIRYFNDYSRSLQLLSLGLRPVAKKPPNRSIYTSVAQAQEASRKTWMSLARKVRREEPPITVISEESLMGIEDPKKLAFFLNRIFDRVFIVVYVRNPVTRYPSSIDQWIREGRPTVRCIKGRLLPPLLPPLLKYEAAFGALNMIVRNFDCTNWQGGTPSSDFAYVMSCIADRGVTLQDAGQKNFSNPASVSHSLLQHNDRLHIQGQELTQAWRKLRNALINELRQIKGVLEQEKLNLAGTPLLPHLCHLFRDEVDQINDRYLSDQIPISLPCEGIPMLKAEVRPAFTEWMNSYQDASVAQLVADLKAMVERPRINSYLP